jgi:hypothetical protein
MWTTGNGQPLAGTIEPVFDTLVRDSVEVPAPSELDDEDLVEAMRAWERLASWAAAGQLAAIAELARRRPRDFVDAPTGHADAGHPGVPEVSEFAVDEVSAALRLSRAAAGIRLHAAVELTRLLVTAAALADGVVDLPKVRAVVEAVTVLDDETARAVEQRVLPRAGGQTVGQLRASLTRAVLAADPAAAEARHQRAVAGRQVTITPGRDGMAELWALLPADGAAAVYAAVDRVARQGSADDRGMDARRADALVVLATRVPTAALTQPPALAAPGAPAAGRGGPGTALPRVPASVHVTVPAATVLGLGEEPGELAGHGPVPASMARRLADRAPWRKVTVDGTTGEVTGVGRTPYSPSAALADLVRVRDRTCRFPGCRQSARRCDLDHVTPWPTGPTTAGNLAALCRHQQHVAGCRLDSWVSVRRWSGRGGATSPG